MTSRTSRRSFLKTALAAGAAPLLLPSRVWSAETKPNDRIALGVIGVGKQAHYHLPKFLGKSETQIVAVCDVDTTRRNDGKRIVEDGYAKQTGESYKGCDTYSDFREVLGRKDIDAVVIVTPDHWHALISIAAADAGKDIYCEKPLTETIHEAKAVIAAARKNNRVFQVGSQQRSSREFRVACELVRNGVIGKVGKVMAGFGAPAKWCDLPEEPMEAGLDWDRWLGPAPMRPYNSILSPRGVHTHFPLWREYWEYGGGYVTDWGAHHVDIAQWGLGVDANSGPVEMTPPADWQTAKAGGKLRYADGCELEHIEQNGVTFFGDKGTIYVNRGVCQFIIEGKEVALFKALKNPPTPETPLPQQLEAVEKEFLTDPKVKLYHSDDHHADWISCIKSRQRPIVDVETGARSAIACHLLNVGYRYGQTVKWEPEKMEFASGSGDPKWLTRDYRDPWRVA
jgi:predicted dehydrogenase